jgi:hypothetical protein
MTSSLTNDLPLISVKENEDGSFTLEWDETDPRCEEINNWTYDEWVKAIEHGLARF